MNDSILGARIAALRTDIAQYSRDPKHPATLVAVTKTVGAETINRLKEHGQWDIGENRAQVITEKLPYLDKNFKIHFIGRLQSNKIRYIIECVSLIHSLDRVDLARELHRHAEQKGLVKDVLLQVNVANEQQKAGFDIDALMDFVAQVKHYPALRVKGLMAIMPFIDDELALAGYFKIMKQLFDSIRETAPPGVEMDILSMGMSHDYKIALAEGANMIRVGSALFGE